MGDGGFDFAKEFGRLADAGEKESTRELGGVAVRLVRLAGGTEGRWDSHGHTAETAILWSGDFSVEFRDRTLHLKPGQCCVVPLGAEHRGRTKDGAEVVLLTTVGG